ncbi:MAG: helix-hairpin-helix domain-containing protein [Sphingomonadaceae bacterium]
MAGFSEKERAILLDVKGVGKTVVQRLEEMGIHDLETLSGSSAEEICQQGAVITGSTCWANAPRARAAIDSAIEAARRYSATG